VPADALQLAKKVIGRVAPRINFAKYHDTYEEALREMIDARIAGDEIVTTPGKTASDAVVNLMDALRKSLAEATPKPRPAKGSRKPRPAGRGSSDFRNGDAPNCWRSNAAAPSRPSSSLHSIRSQSPACGSSPLLRTRCAACPSCVGASPTRRSSVLSDRT
jgi:DNA end-binding protein Ku